MVENRPQFTVFIVEDDDWYGRLIEYILSLDPDFHTKRFSNGADLLEALPEQPDMITLDYRLPDMDGRELLRKIRKADNRIEVVMVSEQESIETAVELLREGAYDYIVKHEEMQDQLLNIARKIRKQGRLQQRIDDLEEEIEKKYQFQNSIIGSSPAMKKVFGMIDKALRTNISVLISGETGTGKEVVAKAIHYNSTRKKMPFVAVNVSAIPNDLIESELFGHEKGAFTGALSRRIGKFEEASGGTLFLDEIGEMELPMQAKLLRALQEKEIVRIGGNGIVRTDCRVIAASNRNLLDEVKEGNFRQDLYYRLYGLPIQLPPLRDRGNDILILAKHFIEQFCEENDLPPKSLSGPARTKLMNYDFPGNVRELRSLMELAVVMAEGEEINPEDITLPEGSLVADLLTEELTLKEYNHRIINAYLEKYDRNVLHVADKLGIGKSTIYRMLKDMEEHEEDGNGN